MLVRCAHCSSEFELDVLLALMPDVVLCASCEEARAHAPVPTPAPSLELEEAGKDGCVLQLDLEF